MRILVTGATGFVGLHLIDRLADKHAVYALVRGENLVHGCAQTVRCDLRNEIDIKRLPRGIDVIIHLAQSRHGRAFPTHANDIFGVNVASTQALLQYALINHVRHFILASSGSVYSALADVREARETAMAPNYYAASKLAAELMVRPYQQLMTVCLLRLFTPYGPGQYDRLVSDLIDRVSNDRPVMIVGNQDGLQFHPTYIADVVSVIERALQERWAGTYDVANAQGFNIRQAAEEIGAVIRKTPNFEREDGPAQPVMLPNLAPLRARFPVATFCSFDRGLRATIGENSAGPHFASLVRRDAGQTNIARER